MVWECLLCCGECRFCNGTCCTVRFAGCTSLLATQRTVSFLPMLSCLHAVASRWNSRHVLGVLPMLMGSTPVLHNLNRVHADKLGCAAHIASRSLVDCSSLYVYSLQEDDVGLTTHGSVLLGPELVVSPLLLLLLLLVSDGAAVKLEPACCPPSAAGFPGRKVTKSLRQSATACS
jgi:hypothetical protein